MEKRGLLIGATGLLGKPVACRLKQEGYTVRLFVIEQELNMAKHQFGDGYEIAVGDIGDLESIERALDGCFGVHINLSGEIEQIGVENVASVARKLDLQRISYISGTSVSEENIWTPTIKRKYYAEKAIRDSGVPYSIFCPNWFMENLPRYIRGKKGHFVWQAAQSLSDGCGRGLRQNGCLFLCSSRSNQQTLHHSRSRRAQIS